MLSKFFFARDILQELFSSAPPRPQAVEIVHAGRITEYYYKKVPASEIMGKYPSSVLARPTIFRRPWDSLVSPHEMLTPGEKYFVVPRGTVRKLLCRIRRPADQSAADGSTCSSSFSIFKRSTVTTGPPSRTNHRTKEAAAITSKTKLPGRKAATNGKPAGIPMKKGGSPGSRRSSEAKASRQALSSTTVESSGKRRVAAKGIRRVQTSGTWSPSLPTISEVSPSS